MQNKEFVDGSGLELYDFGIRNYDQQIGIFRQIDPHSDNYFGWSSYNYCANNPFLITDPTGMDWYLGKTGYEWHDGSGEIKGLIHMKTGTWSERDENGFAYYFGDSKDGLLQSGPNDLLEEAEVECLYPAARRRLEKEWLDFFAEEKERKEMVRLGMWDEDLTEDEARRNAASYVELAMPSSLIKSATIATGVAKVVKVATKATGQIHHLLSNKIMAALKVHPRLKGIFNRETQALMYRAYDEASHLGYQTWHREYDAKVVEWLGTNINATADEFIKFLHDLHQEPWLKNRIPGVYLLDFIP